LKFNNNNNNNNNNNKKVSIYLHFVSYFELYVLLWIFSDDQNATTILASYVT